MLGYYLVETLKRKTFHQASIAMAIWIFSSLTLELCVTVTSACTIPIISRMAHLGFGPSRDIPIPFTNRYCLLEHDGVFKMVWKVTWVRHSFSLPDICGDLSGQISAALPPILMTVVSINGYIINNISHPLTGVTADSTVYALSLMITITGRGLIRSQLDGSAPKDRFNTVLTVSDLPAIVVTHRSVESSAYEMEPRGPTANTLNEAPSEREIIYCQDSVRIFFVKGFLN
ncbi:unnamed protein product [Rhizoctonia solani]|uniref:Uncharacterized protein n=1 Tax=Rhizoctonia solani TaxID=456999 RepID=A0A8H3AKA7_9AGAM|nr:unnamed protein product [Rhizoctonia solani]